MRVRALDSNNDWTFGRGRANYITGKDAVNQNVQTRIKSFKNDNPLNIETNIDWRDLLGRKGTESDILNEIERVVRNTDNITEITQLEVDKTENRVQTIRLSYKTAYDETEEQIEIRDL